MEILNPNSSIYQKTPSNYAQMEDGVLTPKGDLIRSAETGYLGVHMYDDGGYIIARIKGLMPDYAIVELMRYKDFVFVSTQVNCDPPVNGHQEDWKSEGHAFVFRKEEARASDGPTWQVLSVFGMSYN